MWFSIWTKAEEAKHGLNFDTEIRQGVSKPRVEALPPIILRNWKGIHTRNHNVINANTAKHQIEICGEESTEPWLHKNKLPFLWCKAVYKRSTICAFYRRSSFTIIQVLAYVLNIPPSCIMLSQHLLKEQLLLFIFGTEDYHNTWKMNSIQFLVIWEMTWIKEQLDCTSIITITAYHHPLILECSAQCA